MAAGWTPAVVSISWHIREGQVVPGLISALGVAAMPSVMGNPSLLLLVSLAAVGGNVVANALYWNLPTAVLSGAAAAIGIAFINAFGQPLHSYCGWLDSQFLRSIFS